MTLYLHFQKEAGFLDWARAKMVEEHWFYIKKYKAISFMSNWHEAMNYGLKKYLIRKSLGEA